MKSYSRSHLTNEALRRTILDRAIRDCENTAELLADIAAFDERKLYRDDGYDSIHAWCIGVLHLSEDSAGKRIYAARAAREFPAIFVAVASGRLNLSGVVQLASHLAEMTEDAAARLLSAAEHRTRNEIAILIAESYPQPAPPTTIEVLSAQCSSGTLSFPQQVTPVQHAPGQVSVQRTAVAPLAADTYILRGAMPGEMRELLAYLQSLLGPDGRDEMRVLHMGLQALKPILEKRKFAATSKPRSVPGPPSSNPRHIPAHVKRAVWQRDRGQCTFVSADGRRCEATRNLQFDHGLEICRGGESTVANVRLRCHAHNQLTAEQNLGAEFMRNRRIAAQEAREQEREARRTRAEAERAARQAERARAEEEKARTREAEALEKDPDHSVVPWLRALGIPLEDARRAAKAVEHMTDARLEEKVKAAASASVRHLVRRPVSVGEPHGAA
jgi:hypothetical protein